jgi:hypothetical protein
VAYENITLGWYVDSGHVAISLNGSAWVVVANSSIPTITANFSVGGGDNPFVGLVHWMTMGVGTITDSDIATLHACGNKDLLQSDYPVSHFAALDPSFLWWAIDNTHVPCGAWGDGVYP